MRKINNFLDMHQLFISVIGLVIAVIIFAASVSWWPAPASAEGQERLSYNIAGRTKAAANMDKVVAEMAADKENGVGSLDGAVAHSRDTAAAYAMYANTAVLDGADPQTVYDTLVDAAGTMLQDASVIARNLGIAG